MDKVECLYVFIAYIGPCPRADRSKGPQGIFLFFCKFQKNRFFALYGILGNTDLCKRMPRGMPSFSTIACLILTTFQNLRFCQIFRPNFSKISVLKSEFLMPTYQPTTITMSISINSTLFSPSIAISGGMRVHFMKESVPSQTFQCGWTPPPPPTPTPEEFWKPARPPSIMRLG